MRPFRRACGGWDEVLHGIENALALRPFVLPKVNADLVGNLCHPCQRHQGECGVMEGAGALELLGQLAICRDLLVDAIALMSGSATPEL